MATRKPRGRLREEILDVADGLLLERGDAHEIPIDAVVEAVGCTPPALYYYFPSKEQLLFEVCRRRYTRFAEELEESIPATEDPVAELVARGHAYLDWAVAHPEHYRLLFMTAAGAAPDASSADPRQGAGLAELIDNLQRAVGTGKLAPGDPLQMAVALWSTVHGVASLLVANPALPVEFAHGVVAFTATAVLRAMAPAAPSPGIP